MTLSVSCRTAIAVAIGLACSDTARADTADYAFQLLQPETTLSEPGTYRFMAKLTMEGGWRLSLAAKIQGEAGTLEKRLTFRAAP